jgi:hypothetical protein
MLSMACASKHLSDENMFGIRKESDESLISDISNDFWDDIAVAPAVEYSEAEEEGRSHSLVDTDYTSGFVCSGRESFSGHPGPQDSTVNPQEIVSVFLLFISRDIVHKFIV